MKLMGLGVVEQTHQRHHRRDQRSANATIALTAVGSEPSRPVMINGLTAPRKTSAVRLIDAGSAAMPRLGIFDWDES